MISFRESSACWRGQQPTDLLDDHVLGLQRLDRCRYVRPPAEIRAAGTDSVQSILVTVINLSIAAGGVFGGLLLAGPDVSSIPIVACALMLPTVVATIAVHRHAFPRWPGGR